MNSKATLALFTILLLLGSTTAIKSMDDCDGEKEEVKDGEFYKDGERADDLVVDQIVLNMRDALGFDVRVLLAPCVDSDGINWYLAQLTQWSNIFKDPEGVNSDFAILHDVKDLIQVAKDKISENDDVPVQSLIQLKIKALSQIEDINPNTSFLGDKMEEISQMVELLNKAKDVQTAEKLADIIIMKLDQSIAEFQEVIDEEENFPQYQAIIDEKISNIQNSPCASPENFTQEVIELKTEINSELMNDESMVTEDQDQIKEEVLSQFIQMSAQEDDEDDQSELSLDDDSNELSLDADSDEDSNNDENDFDLDSDNNTNNDESADSKDIKRINEKLQESEKKMEQEGNQDSSDAKTEDSIDSNESGINTNDGALMVEMVEKKAKTSTESSTSSTSTEEDKQNVDVSETFEEWEHIFEGETLEMEKANVQFNNFVPNPETDILMDEEREELKREKELYESMKAIPTDENGVFELIGQVDSDKEERTAWENEPVQATVEPQTDAVAVPAVTEATDAATVAAAVPTATEEVEVKQTQQNLVNQAGQGKSVENKKKKNLRKSKKHF